MKKQDIRLTIRDIQALVYKEYLKNGYKENWDIHKQIGDIAELGLVVSEVSEAIEELRNIRDYMKITDIFLDKECADIVIRVMNFMSRKGLDLQTAILEKNKINLKRGYLHGKST
jgi:hypothetical protein